MHSDSNKRIAKNTAALYFRMLLTMIVTLYTSRVVLNTLGVEDFGIYNVVGGIVVMFSFLNSAMASATQRFLSFEMGKNNQVQLRRVFSMSVNIHAIIAGVILILAETIGLWFLNTQMNIPEARMSAANWIYQFAILSFIATVLSVPYNAAIIANERMNVYAYVSIIDVVLKLVIVYMLVLADFDKLKFYAVLTFAVTTLVWIIYRIYCYRKFTETHYLKFWDKKLYSTLMNYAGWNLFGNVAGVAMGQGVNILLNIFFGPAVNAARGIAFQVNSAVNSFVLNFQTAMNPQIVKSFAAGDLTYMHQLIFRGARFSFYLIFALTLPVLLETEIILKLWLKTVPEYTIIFTRLVLLIVIVDSVSGPLMTAAQASGKIKLYQGIVGSMLFLILPISYIFLKLGFQPYIVLLIHLCMATLCFIVRLLIISPLVSLKKKDFVIKVGLNVIPVLLIASLIPVLFEYFMYQGYLKLFLVAVISLLSAIITIYTFGLQKEERLFFNNKIRGVLRIK